MNGIGLPLALDVTIIKYGAMDLFEDYSMVSTPFSYLRVIVVPIVDA